MEVLVESILVLGRASLGATIGLAIGWPTQRERHSWYVAGWVFAGFVAGVVTMWPHWGHIIAALALLPISGTVGTFFGWCVGAVTLGGREDWWLRSWGFAGFIVCYQLLAVLAAYLIALPD